MFVHNFTSTPITARTIYEGAEITVHFAPGRTTKVNDFIMFDITRRGLLLNYFKKGMLREAPTEFTYSGQKEIHLYELLGNKDIALCWLNQTKYKEYLKSLEANETELKETTEKQPTKRGRPVKK